MAWLLLLAAALVDIAMAVALKYADGWTRLWPSI
ncbi:SMR family transporter, partial [Massilia sp. 2TAF26]